MQLLLRLVLIKRDRDMFSPPEPPSREFCRELVIVRLFKTAGHTRN
jgi:hypothetical protein